MLSDLKASLSGLCTTAVAADPPLALQPLLSHCLNSEPNSSDAGRTRVPLPTLAHLLLRSKGSGALFADRGTGRRFSDLMLFRKAEAPSVP